jgi:hypothetical protein
MARTVKIVQASRLELRNVTTTEGTVEEYIIITGSPAVVLVDEDEVEGARLEYNKTRRKLRVVGAGSFKSKTETVAGKDFDVDLETQGLQGSDVFIATEDIDIVGISCERLPGQLEVQSGYFSPCARCGTSTDAYGFRASNITLYPGDRLIARDVTILLGGVPVFYLPIVVVFLNDPTRQPRFEINQTSTTDGTTVDLDLPFTISDFGAGFTLLRYFEKRTPAFGFGVDLTLYDIFSGSNRTRLFFMALPPPVGNPGGAQFAYQVTATGEVLLRVGVDPEDELPPLRYELNINRVDSGISEANDLRGVTGENKRSNFSVRLTLENENYLAQLETRGFWDHRDLPIPGDQVSEATYNAGLPRGVLYLPEFRFTARGNLLPKFDVFSVTAWGFTLGIVTAPFDPLNTSARRLAGNGPYVSAGKLSFNWGVGLDVAPWQEARVNGTATFRGQYYSTSNPDPTDPNAYGDPERNITFGANLSFRQSLFANAVDFNAAYAYTIAEGESPFAFDKIPTRPPNSSLTLGLNARPFPWAGASFGQRIEFTRLANPLDPLTFSLTLNPAPINAAFTSSFDWDTNMPVAYSVSLGNSVPSGVNFSVQTGYQFAQRLTPNFVPRWDDLRFTVGYRSPDAGRFSASLSFVQNLNNGEIRGWTASSLWILGSTENPVTLNLTQTLTPPQYSNIAPSPPQEYARLNGSFSLRFQNYTLNLTNNLDFKPFTFSPSTPQPNSNFSVSLSGTEPLPWSLTFNSTVDLATFELFRPSLIGSIGTRAEVQGGAFEFNLSFLLQLPWRDQTDWRISSASLNFGWDVLPGFSMFGNVTYSRTLEGGFFKDSFVFNPFGVSLGFAQIGSQRPNVFFALYIAGRYEYSDNPAEQGQRPIFTPGTVAGVTTSSSGGSFPSDFRPVFVMRYDQCCYAIQIVVDGTPKEGVNFSFSIILPFGKQDLFTTSATEGVRFPILPFIPPLK